MSDDKAIYGISMEDYLKGRILFLRNKIKEIKNEISQAEKALHDLEVGTVKSIIESPQQLRLPDTNGLDFSVTKWKPLVYNFLFENPSKYTSEQILLGIDLSKDYQKKLSDKLKTIKTISSCLFQLHKSEKIEKIENPGRKGYKWAVKEPGPSQLPAAGIMEV